MTKQAQLKKRKSYQWGVVAEWVCILYLMLKGYRILARRFKCKSGEIDFIAQKGDMICFIEVKARQKIQDALMALSFRQQQRIIKAAEWYLARNIYGKNGGMEAVSCRFDLMAVEPWRLPTHVKDAWQMDVKV
ncbi:MAG: YraN family protein [Emcibacter sp.]|nr:YraN family protein [Emcibacter sp.]